MHPFLTQYNEVALPKLKEFKNYESTYQIPSVSKVSVNCGLGDVMTNDKQIEEVSKLIGLITGQKPVETKARKAISGFKIRQNMVIGLKVTLRGARMHDFLAKLTQIALPRTRDFRGLKPSAITADGNLNIGIKDSMIFPEAPQEAGNHGIQITVVSSATSMEEARLLFESLGFVFSTEEIETKKSGKRSGKRK